jgi:adenylyl-sulfate kinase
MAAALTAALRDRQSPVLVLDGDTLRERLCRNLGFSDADRMENLRRAAEVARLGVDSGLCVVASFITPLETHRRMIRETIGSARISLVFADSPLAVCQERDVKGLYARAQSGQVKQMTGISSSFEAPAGADLTLDTATMPPTDSAHRLIAFAHHRLGLAV